MEYRYNRVRYGSKYEMQWAVFLDALGITWRRERNEYEDYGNMFLLPDKNLLIGIVDGDVDVVDEELYPEDSSTYPTPVLVTNTHKAFSDLRHSWRGEFRKTDHAFGICPDIAGQWNCGDQLKCPVCASDQVEFYYEPKFKGDGTFKIEMVCGGSKTHYWSVRYGSVFLGPLKASTYRKIEDVGTIETNLLLWLAGWDEARLRNAIRIVNGARQGRTIPPSIRFAVLKRDAYRCQLCGQAAGDGTTLEVDHKIAWAKGGGNGADNLWTLCRECNLGKSDRGL